MNIALATYGDRIASLFESSDRFVIFDSRSGQIEKPRTLIIRDSSPNTLLHQLKANEAQVLICGAISGCTSQMLEGQGIQVIPWVKGHINDVMEAYRTRHLFSPGFRMPGCRRRGHRGRHWCGGGRTEKN
ncbi:hypothetical protein GF337_12375 [candidate division KSB1 bacterium]|nr:hypothetical protein [candidate division KSB1 bacterium]